MKKQKRNAGNILFLIPYPPGTAGSQRFRFEQYYAYLEQGGFRWKVQSFLDERAWSILYKPGFLIKKSLGILRGFLRRFFILFQLSKFDFVFIHREASPVGPPVFEFLIAKVFRKKIIFDFDDAVWLPNTSEFNPFIARFKFHGKTASICRWSWKVSAGNDFLADYARKYCENVVVNPTTIDTENLHNRSKNQMEMQDNKPVVGWTGTHTTLRFIEDLVPLLKKVYQISPFKLIVIANKNPKIDFPDFEYIEWSKQSEIDDLMRFNVGLMPLTVDPWAEGKCGFKALQYMSLGIPAIASPVGVNEKIIDNQLNGFLCTNDNEWIHAIQTLIRETETRVKFGKEARQKIERTFSVKSNADNFLGLFQNSPVKVFTSFLNE